MDLSGNHNRHALAGPVNLWKMKRDFQINFLKFAGLLPHHYLLDLGCGTLRGGIPIIDYLEPGRYYGVESRENVLLEGRKELKEMALEHKKPTLKANDDISILEFPVEFPYIWAFSVLVHMSDEILDRCLQFIARQLRWDGCFYANVISDGLPDGSWQGFPVVHRQLEFYETFAERNNLVVEDIGPLYKLGHISYIKTHDEQRMLRFFIKE